MTVVGNLHVNENPESEFAEAGWELGPHRVDHYALQEVALDLEDAIQDEAIEGARVNESEEEAGHD